MVRVLAGFAACLALGCAPEMSSWDSARMTPSAYAEIAAGVDGSTPQERAALLTAVEQVADAVVPYDWRAAGISVVVACRNTVFGPCPIGLFVSDGTVVISPHARWLTDDALTSLVAHEFAHGWQWLQPWPAGSLIADVDVPMPDRVPLPELEADCIVAWWGVTAVPGMSYWTCPAVAIAAVEGR